MDDRKELIVSVADRPPLDPGGLGGPRKSIDIGIPSRAFFVPGDVRSYGIDLTCGRGDRRRSVPESPERDLSWALTRLVIL